MIAANFAKELNENFPQFDWDPGQWKKWLGVLPALGGAVVTTPKPKPPDRPFAGVKTTCGTDPCTQSARD